MQLGERRYPRAGYEVCFFWVSIRTPWPVRLFKLPPRGLLMRCMHRCSIASYAPGETMAL